MAPTLSNPPVLLLCGPTAVGKSEVALRLAEALGGEIVSVDSMQVYRGMDLGTAKPSPQDRSRIEHHLIDVAELTQQFDVSQFVLLAAQALAVIRARGRVPILCGGTGLYFKALLEGLGNGPASDPQLRAQLKATPLPELLLELAKADPAAYDQLDRKNPRRVIRALEVIRLTGRPYSQQQAAWRSGGAKSSPHPRLVGLMRPTEELRARIDVRVERMFRDGLVAETRALLEKGLATNETAMQALGYRQVVEHLNGARPLDETIELVKLRTRQFAKRQMTWFRRQMEVDWIQPAPDEPAAQTADCVAKNFVAGSAG